jgi:hypothetical protein
MGIPVIDVNLKSVAASEFSVCLLVLLARLVDLSCYCVACFPLFLGTNNLAASKLALHYFKKNNPPGGSLVLTCSTAGYNARPNIVLYSAAKHGVCPTNPSKCSLNNSDNTTRSPASSAPSPYSSPLNPASRSMPLPLEALVCFYSPYLWPSCTLQINDKPSNRHVRRTRPSSREIPRRPRPTRRVRRPSRPLPR